MSVRYEPKTFLARLRTAGEKVQLAAPLGNYSIPAPTTAPTNLVVLWSLGHVALTIDRIRLQPLAPLESDAFISLYITAGGVDYLIHRERIPARTHPERALSTDDPPGAVDLSDGELLGPIILLQGQTLRAACDDGTAFDVVAYGSDQNDVFYYNAASTI